ARFTRPVLVLPDALVPELDDACLRLVLEHELAHLKRGDLLRATLVSLARIPYTFHPVATWLGREIALAREQAVDLLVGHEDPKTYADLLITVAIQARFGEQTAEVSMACSSLERRLVALIEPRAVSRAAAGGVLALGTLLLCMVMLAPKSYAHVEN